MTTNLKGILFDLDGVIADTEDYHRRAYNLAFEEAGLSIRWSEQDYRDRLVLSGGSKLETIDLPVPESEAAAFRQKIYQRKRCLYQRLLETEPLHPRPGVVRFIEESLSSGLLIGAASTCAKEGALAILREALGPDLAGRFRTVRAGEDVIHRKPAPDIYLLALGDLELPAACCIAVEDSRHGMLAAKAAGLWTLVTPSRYTRGSDFSEADCVVDDLDSGKVTIEFIERKRTTNRNLTGKDK